MSGDCLLRSLEKHVRSLRRGGGTILLKAENDIVQTIFFMVFEMEGDAEGVIDGGMTFSEFGFSGSRGVFVLGF